MSVIVLARQVTYLRRQRRVEKLTTKLTLTERPQKTYVSTAARANDPEGVPVARPKLWGGDITCEPTLDTPGFRSDFCTEEGSVSFGHIFEAVGNLLNLQITGFARPRFGVAWAASEDGTVYSQSQRLVTNTWRAKTEKVAPLIAPKGLDLWSALNCYGWPEKIPCPLRDPASLSSGAHSSADFPLSKAGPHHNTIGRTKSRSLVASCKLAEAPWCSGQVKTSVRKSVPSICCDRRHRGL